MTSRANMMPPTRSWHKKSLKWRALGRCSRGRCTPGRARGTEPHGVEQVRYRHGGGADGAGSGQCQQPRGSTRNSQTTWRLDTTDQLFLADQYKQLIVAYRNGAPVRLEDIALVIDSVEDRAHGRFGERQACRFHDGLPPARGKHHQDRRQRQSSSPVPAGFHPAGHESQGNERPHHHHTCLRRRRGVLPVDLHRAGHPSRFRLPAQSEQHGDPQRGCAGFADQHLRSDVSAGLQHRQSIADGVDHFDRIRGG